MSMASATTQIQQACGRTKRTFRLSIVCFPEGENASHARRAVPVPMVTRATSASP
jgi:hypothetical protein